ncbi:hypothetical protein [Pelagerythrobacter aerophilus]|uniref:DUF2285 domain-containing protein n=1 Tax=Pelagerythrobacter aerophilus TaxID=2306995 RepID=A0A418NL21_9SPHN|nr:hypothetical protein [Pelagerythrobacter aerophilus]RIV80327.1 hypothetical protein D2V04_03285 [Pelagerythrobacter aerophilus]
MNCVLALKEIAPSGEPVTGYDREHLVLYAALIDADDGGGDWREVASTIMKIDVHSAGAKDCWRSHLERARWIVGDGLAAALEAFGSPADLPAD